MKIEVKVPQLSESVSEASLLTWNKQVGEAVTEGESLIDIETDKVVLELPAIKSGVLIKILKQNGEKVSSAEVLAVAPSTSSLITLPPRPLPLIAAVSSPFSVAIFCAAGITAA